MMGLAASICPHHTWLNGYLGMSDRIVVMREGRIAGEVRDVANATQEDILSMAIA